MARRRHTRTTMELLGEGYGQAAEATRKKHQREDVLKRLSLSADLEMVAVFYDHGDDIEGTGPSESARTLTLEAILIDLQEDRWATDDQFDEVESIGDVSSMYRDMNDHDWGGCSFIGTVEDYEKRQQEERRAELETAAAVFAQSHNVRSGSMEFIAAVEAEIERVRDQQEEWNNPERRMEEWAACQHTGGGSEVYFDDLNFENGRYASRRESLFGIMEWLEQNCPLLMAKYRETKLAAG